MIPRPRTAPLDRCRGSRPAHLAVGLLAVAVLTCAGCGTSSEDAAGDGGSDGQSQAVDPTPTASTPTASGPAASSSPPSTPAPGAGSSGATAAPTPEGKPVEIDTAAAALEAKFPLLVPTILPGGWSLTGARFDAGGGGRSTIRLRDRDGVATTLVQARGSVADLVAAAGGTGAPVDRLDLSSYGVGTWKVYTVTDGVIIAKKFSSTAAAITAASTQTGQALAESLITAEDTDLPQAG